MVRWTALVRRAVITGTSAIDRARPHRQLRVIIGAIGYWAFDNAVLWATFKAFGFSPDIMIVLMGYLIGQLGGLLPIPGGIGGIDGGLIGTLIVYGVPAAATAAAVLAYRVILFWLPLILGGIAFVAAAPRHAARRRARGVRGGADLRKQALPVVTIPRPRSLVSATCAARSSSSLAGSPSPRRPRL